MPGNLFGRGYGEGEESVISRSFLRYAWGSLRFQAGFLVAAVLAFEAVSYLVYVVRGGPPTGWMSMGLVAAAAHVPGWVVIQAVLLSVWRRRRAGVRETVAVVAGPVLGTFLVLEAALLGGGGGDLGRSSLSYAMYVGVLMLMTYLPVWVALRLGYVYLGVRRDRS